MSQCVVERALECHAAGHTLYQMVDGKSEPAPPEVIAQYAEWLRSRTPEERAEINVNPLIARWTTEAN